MFIFPTSSSPLFMMFINFYMCIFKVGVSFLWFLICCWNLNINSHNTCSYFNYGLKRNLRNHPSEWTLLKTTYLYVWKIVQPKHNNLNCLFFWEYFSLIAKLTCSKFDTTKKTFCTFKALKPWEGIIFVFFKHHFFYQMCTYPSKNWRGF
jgi:hypothetical protein